MAAKFVVFKDKKGEFRFRLLAANGEIIAASEGYKAKTAALAGIRSIKKNAPIAAIVDETEEKAKEKKPTAKAKAAPKPAAKETAKPAAKPRGRPKNN